jgi:hypothetical protein
MVERSPATVTKPVRALGAAVHDLTAERHEPDKPRGLRPDLWGTAGEIPAVYPAMERWTDMDWLAQLAISGATTLVGAAATDAWRHAREGFARLLGRGDRDREAVAEQRLQALAAKVEGAPLGERAELRERLVPAWQTRLADLLEEDPAAAELLSGLVDELQAALPEERQQWIQTIITRDHSTAYAALGGNVIHYDLAGKPTSAVSGEAEDQQNGPS